MEVKITKDTYTNEELRERFPDAVKAYTKAEARERIIAAMKTFPGELEPGMTVDFLVNKFEETYGFKEGNENEFGEVSP